MTLILTYHRVCAEPIPSASGAEHFYTVTRAQLAAQLDSLSAAGYEPFPLAALARLATPPAERSFVLSFDDGTADHVDIVRPLLLERGISGLFFIPTAKLDRPGYLTRGQLRELSAAGLVIGCHSHEHHRLDTLSPAAVRDQLRIARDQLEQQTGQRVWAFAPPGGFITPQVQAVALECGFPVIRTMRWGFNLRLNFAALETIPVNRHTNQRRFQKILEGKRPRLLYFGKQAAKALVPERTYQHLRNLAFKLRRKH